MEHSKNWSVILKFLWDNLPKQELLQNPRFYSWSIIKVGQWFCNSCGKTYSNKKHFNTHVFIHGAFEKLVSDSEIFVGKHSNKKHLKTHVFIHGQSKSWPAIQKLLWESIFKQESLQHPLFYSWSILRVGQWFCNSCGRTYSNKKHFKTLVIIHGALYKLVIDSYIIVGKHIQRSII